MNTRLRPALPSDSAALGVILSDWIDATPWMPRIHTRDQDRCFIARLIDEMEVTLVEAAAPLGFLARRETFVHALYLAPSARRVGLGARLLEQAKDRAGTLTLWTFQANRPALAFYARQGFAEVERTDGAGNDEKLPDVRLEWPVDRQGLWQRLMGRLGDGRT